jgi:hypothetical protein
VRVILEERFEIVLHLVGDFDVECAHCVTRVLHSVGKSLPSIGVIPVDRSKSGQFTTCAW